MEGTLSSILTFKLADVNAVKFKLPSELLKKAKGATWEYNKQHKRKKSRGGTPIRNRRGCSSEIVNLTPKGDLLGVA